MREIRLSRREFLTQSMFSACFALMLFSKKPDRSDAWESIPDALNRARKKKTDPERYPSYRELYLCGELTRRIKDLQAYYENCRLCPRDCRVDRTKGQKGKCQASSGISVSSAHPHFGEERPLVGTHGSGTIFFSNCGLRCIYCQNYSISIEGEGVEISDRRLAASMLTLQGMGCHNINLVTPTHYIPSIVNALAIAIPQGLKIPLVYNTSGYERLEVLQLLDGIVDIYLPDSKYMDPELAAKYSEGAHNYPYYFKIALREMNRQVGALEVDKGIAIRGLIIRHLVLPNWIAGTEEFLKFVAENFPKNTYLNIMGQYRPEYKAPEYSELARRLKRSEYKEAWEWAKKYGIRRLAR